MDERRKQITDLLAPGEQRFCQASIFNKQYKAYMVAFPKATKKEAYDRSYKLLQKPRIQEYIDMLKGDVELMSGVSKIRNLTELAKIAYSSIAHLHNTWIELKAFEDLDDDDKAAIEIIGTRTIKRGEYDELTETFENVEIDEVKVKMHGKIPAITEINKMQGYYQPNKVSVQSKVQVVSEYESIPTDELIKRAKAIKLINESKRDGDS